MGFSKHIWSNGNDRVRTAIARLLSDQPFYGSLAMRMTLEESESVRTMGCDGRRILYNDKWSHEAEMHDLKVALAHIVTACALEHNLRRGMRDYAIWQEASRAVTGFILNSSGIARSAHSSWDYSDKSVEEVYDDLAGRQEQQEQREKEREEEEKREQQAAGSASGGEGESQKQEEQKQEEQTDGNGGSGDDAADGRAGESQGEEMSQEQEASQPADKYGRLDATYGPIGEVLDAPEETDTHEMALSMNLAARSAGKLTEMYGTAIPGGLREFITSAGAAPDMAWQDVLKEYMHEIAKEDYSWVPPNSRYLWQDMYLPSMRSEGSGHIAVVIDTSGSINEESLKMFWAGVREMMDEVVPTGVTIICCDAQVHSVHEFTQHNLPEDLDTSGGGGGTRFTGVWKHITEAAEPPMAVLFWTDLCVPKHYVGDDPGVPVLWLKVGSVYRSAKPITPDFGTVINL